MSTAALIHSMEWIDSLLLLVVAGISFWSFRRSNDGAFLFLTVGLGIWALGALASTAYVAVANTALGPPSGATAVLAPESNAVFMLRGLLFLLGALLLLVATHKVIQGGGRGGGNRPGVGG